MNVYVYVCLCMYVCMYVGGDIEECYTGNHIQLPS